VTFLLFIIMCQEASGGAGFPAEVWQKTCDRMTSKQLYHVGWSFYSL